MDTNTNTNAPLDVLAVMDSLSQANVGPLEREAIKGARAAVAELVEAAKYRVEYVGSGWYVLTVDGSAVSNVCHASLMDAKAEAASELRAALAKFGGAA